MDQGMNYQNQQANTFAYNGVQPSMPSTTEHRSVLVSRKFINGLVTNYNKSKENSNDSFVVPNFEMPSFDVPKYDFSNPENQQVETAPVAPEPSVNLSNVEPVTPVETPVQPTAEPDVPKFDFSALIKSVEEKTAQAEAAATAPEKEETKEKVAPSVEVPNDDTTTTGEEGGVTAQPVNIPEEDQEILAKYANIDGISTETMLFEVQSTLNSLANMVSVLTQQRTDLLAQQEEINDANEALDKREEAISLKERTVEEKEAANELQRQEIEKLAADNAKQLSERTLALKAKAQELEDKERAYENKLEELNKNIEKNVEDAKSLKRRAEELNAKEAELDKLSIELKGRLNNLVDAENKFKVIVKEFNDTVNFNNTLNSIATPAKQLKKELNEEKAA